jgi:hypothetical protein
MLHEVYSDAADGALIPPSKLAGNTEDIMIRRIALA